MAPKPQKTPSTDSLLEAVGREKPVADMAFVEEDVVGAEVSGLHFENCEFRDCLFEDAVIRESSFIGCRFAKCRFKQTKFHNTSFSTGKEEAACNWMFCDLSESSFDDCNLSLNKIEKSSAYLTSFVQCSAMGLVFSADVHRPVSKRIMTGGVKFELCRLQYAMFGELDLSRSSFLTCDLREASFRRANLSDCSFAGSAISSADFDGATLDGATIAHADFDKFNLAEPISYAGLIVSRDQAEKLLHALGIVVID